MCSDKLAVPSMYEQSANFAQVLHCADVDAIVRVSLYKAFNERIPFVGFHILLTESGKPDCLKYSYSLCTIYSSLLYRYLRCTDCLKDHVHTAHY